MYNSVVHNPWQNGKRAGANKPLACNYNLIAPPPNVTGELHVGHVLNLVLQRVVSAELEQRGLDVRRVIGLDHAGLAVKRVLVLKRGHASAVAFWSWKRRVGRRVLFEIKRVLCAFDFDKVRFTLDRPFSAAVACAFVRLYNAGLVTRRLRLLWWDRELNAIVSKLETSSKLKCERALTWRFAFKSGEALIWSQRLGAWSKTNYVLSARESFDANASALVVSLAELSLCRLKSVYVTDAISGNALRLIICVGMSASNRCVFVRVLNNARLVLALISAVSPYLNVLAAVNAMVCVSAGAHVSARYSLRTGARVCRKLTSQWFISLHALASCCDMLSVRIEPKRWRRVLFAYTADLSLWCVSRAMSWGHKLPIWRLNWALAVRDTESKALYYLMLNGWAPLRRVNCSVKPIGPSELVFDTWFSSALWCLSCLGWPNKTSKLRSSFSASTVITGFDIIFFWVLKMLLISCFLTRGRLPFATVVVHPIVCDALGQKMSKTKNNAISPRALFNAFGLQSVRFYFASVDLNTQQFKMSLNTLLACRNASTKLWYTQHARASCAACACALCLCKWALTSVFIRIKRTALALRAFNTAVYLDELLNLIRFDLNNYVNLSARCCECVRTLCNLVCWRYRAVVAHTGGVSNLDTCYVNAFAVTSSALRLMLLTSGANAACTNCKRLFVQARAPLRECVRTNITYFDRLRLSAHWQVALWHGSLFAWR